MINSPICSDSCTTPQHTFKVAYLSVAYRDNTVRDFWVYLKLCAIMINMCYYMYYMHNVYPSLTMERPSSSASLLNFPHSMHSLMSIFDMNQSLGYARSMSTILDAWPQIVCQQILASQRTMHPGQPPSKRYNHTRL